MGCKRLKIDKTQICLGDYRHPISIDKREIQPVSIGDTQPEELFTPVATPIAAIKTFGGGNVGSRGVARFAGINLDQGTTHLFFVPYADLYYTIETKNHFILHSAKYYRIITIDNLGEDNLTIMYQCSERGDSTKEAAKA